VTRDEIEQVKSAEREQRRTERGRKVRAFWQRRRDAARIGRSAEPYRQAEQAGQRLLFGGDCGPR